MTEPDRALEYVVVAGGLGPGRIGPIDLDQIAQFGQEKLVVGPLSAALARGPTSNENVRRGRRRVGWRGTAHTPDGSSQRVGWKVGWKALLGLGAGGGRYLNLTR